MRFIERLKIAYVAFREPQAVLAAMDTAEVTADILHTAASLMEKQSAVLAKARTTLEAQRVEVNRLRLQEVEDAKRLLAYQKWCLLRGCPPSEDDLARAVDR